MPSGRSGKRQRSFIRKPIVPARFLRGTRGNGTTSLGTGTLNGTGTATYSTMTLSVGTDSITAQYGGNATFAGSTSAAVSVIVGTPAFTLSLSPSSISVASGGSGTSTITVTPVFGFASAISFTCSGLPAYATGPFV